jgi:hypothetical protein
VTGLCCHRRQRDAKHHRQLDASVGASEPHDFAVRQPRRSSARKARDDVAQRPTSLFPGQDAPQRQLICRKSKAENFSCGGWTPQITLKRHAFPRFLRNATDRAGEMADRESLSREVTPAPKHPSAQSPNNSNCTRPNSRGTRLRREPLRSFRPNASACGRGDFPNAVVAGRYRVAGWPRARAGLIWNVGT